jgi:hypothetical protein
LIKVAHQCPVKTRFDLVESSLLAVRRLSQGGELRLKFPRAVAVQHYENNREQQDCGSAKGAS